MDLRNEFVVSVPVEKAWALFTDLEQIAPCMPGATLESVEGSDYLGSVKVKVGPITVSYRGTASFVERDDDTFRAVLKAEGRDTRGQGNAQALITAQLEPDGDRTRVTVDTELGITGKVAQFGRGAIADVSTKLLNQFVDTLESTLLGETPAATPLGATAPSTDSARAVGPAPEAVPLDLFGTIGIPAPIRRFGPAMFAGLVLGWLLRGRRATA